VRRAWWGGMGRDGRCVCRVGVCGGAAEGIPTARAAGRRRWRRIGHSAQPVGFRERSAFSAARPTAAHVTCTSIQYRHRHQTGEPEPIAATNQHYLTAADTHAPATNHEQRHTANGSRSRPRSAHFHSDSRFTIAISATCMAHGRMWMSNNRSYFPRTHHYMYTYMQNTRMYCEATEPAYTQSLRIRI
jgi:hypothetical protein